MATTENAATGNGSQTQFPFTFPYIHLTDVKAKIDGVTQATTAYTFPTATVLQFNSAPANGTNVLVFRDTSNDVKKATFYPGSAIKAADLNDDIDQILYTVQENENQSLSTLGDNTMVANLNLNSYKCINHGTPTADTDVTNKVYVDGILEDALQNDILVSTDLSKSWNSSTKKITISHNVSGANSTINNSDGNVIQDITVSAQGHVTAAGSTNLDGRYYTETELNPSANAGANVLDARYYTETEVDATLGSYYTKTAADAAFFKQDSTESIQSGDTWSASDTKVATTKAIDARIIDLVDDVGGFVPIASETVFPDSNPDVNNPATGGTIVSIKEIGSTRTPSSGTVTIANGNVSSNQTITITGCGSTVLTAGFGVLVETTSTLHTYAFHRLAPKATEVTTVAANVTNIGTVAGNNTNITTVASNNSNITTVAGISGNVTTVAGSIAGVNTVAGNLTDINNFYDIYQIATGAPTNRVDSTSLQTGDLWFDSSSNKVLMVYDGSAGDGYAPISPSQAVLDDIAIVSGQITHTENLGSIADALTTQSGTNIDQVADNISTINTVAGISSNITTVSNANSNITLLANNNTNITTVATNITDVNRYAQEYTIAANAPTSPNPTEGDLWYDSGNNALKYFTGTQWLAAYGGLTDIKDDTSPELGGHLDCNDKNLTEVGTVSGDNLQIDFGTL